MATIYEHFQIIRRPRFNRGLCARDFQKSFWPQNLTGFAVFEGAYFQIISFILKFADGARAVNSLAPFFSSRTLKRFLSLREARYQR